MKREEELEIVTTAYFLEERINELKNDQQQLQAAKPNKPQSPVEPQLERETINPLPYPDILPDEIEMTRRWKKLLIIAIVAGGVVTTLGNAVGSITFLGTLLGLVGTILLWGGIIYAFKTRSEEKKEKKKLEAESIERKRNSVEYKDKCAEIDEQNQLSQIQKDKELHERYTVRYEDYKKSIQKYKEDVVDYEENTLPLWQKEDSALSLALADTQTALQEVYSSNIIPIQYRKLEVLVYLATFLNTSKYDLKFAIENYNQYVSQCKQDRQIKLQEVQIQIAKETLGNVQYANWLNEQVLDLSEQANDTLNNINNWQKADIAYRTYERIKANRKKKG